MKKFPILHLKKENFTVSFQELGKLLALGIPMALQFSITAIGVIVVQGAINVYGENYMAGFSAAGKLQNIFSTVFVAFGATIATYVGQNRGAGKMDRVKQGVRCTQLMHRRLRYWMWRRHISTQYSGAIRSLEASSYIETPCRDWAMVWCRWSVESLNWWQEPELSCW